MKGIKLIFGLICDDVRLEVGGKISIIGESNLFFLPTIPLNIPLCIITKWSGSPGARANVTLRMLSPDSALPVTIASQELELAETDMDTTYGGTVNKIGWQIQATGIHVIQILLDGEEYGQIDMLVKRENHFKN